MKPTQLLRGVVLGTAALCAVRRLARQGRRISFAGRTVMIAGGSRGLGLVLGRQLIDEGANLAICARDDEDLQRAGNELQARGGKVLAAVCDITKPDSVNRFVDQARERFGRIDVLINNAGVIEVGPFENLPLEAYQLAMDTHFWGPWHFVQAVVPIMKQQGAGRICNISSIGGKVSVPHLLPYCASKFALTAFSEGLRAELAPANIQVTTICPHLMRTGSHPNAYFRGRHWAEFAWFSMGATLPLVSMNAEHAARRIIEAIRHADGTVILGLQANLAARFYSLFPSLSATLLAGVNRLLPGPVDQPTERRPGKDSQSRLTPSWLTHLGDRAGLRNNELG